LKIEKNLLSFVFYHYNEHILLGKKGLLPSLARNRKVGMPKEN